jgi:S-disulfanyl-L-cysteine oxidoreductase SoxD
MSKASALLLALLLASAAISAQAPTYDIGRPPTPEDIRALGSPIAPDGSGLPAGSGTVAEGRALFASRCARCHGPQGEGGIGVRLVGGQGTLASPKPLKTVGSFWPYATTLWDYINRAMPYDEPGRLTAPEVYSAVAFVLNLNGIVGDPARLDATSLAAVKMPNRDGFVPDSRPDTGASPTNRR